jgi:hypothetical protein
MNVNTHDPGVTLAGGGPQPELMLLPELITLWRERRDDRKARSMTVMAGMAIPASSRRGGAPWGEGVVVQVVYATR